MTWAIVILACSAVINGPITNLECEDITSWEMRGTPLNKANCYMLLDRRLEELRGSRREGIMFQGHCYDMIYKE
jgi:hypothetical protein